MATQKFPFLDVDALLKQLELPNVDAKALMESQQKNIEALVAANQKIAENVQKIAEQEQRIIQEAISEWTAAAGEMKPGGDMREQSARQTEAAINAVEEGIKNMRSFAELVAQSQAESMEILNKRMDEGLKELRQQIAKKTGGSPKAKT